jgi:putative transposase
MKLARSTYYYRSSRKTAAGNALERRIALLCAEFPRYGYRRIAAQLRSEGMNVNHKAVARVMRKRGLQVRPLRRFVLTTNSQHDSRSSRTKRGASLPPLLISSGLPTSPTSE